MSGCHMAANNCRQERKWAPKQRSTSYDISHMSVYQSRREAQGAGFCLSAVISDLSISAAAWALSTQKPPDREGCNKSNLQVLDHPEGTGGRSRSRPVSQEGSVCICFLDWESTGVLFPPSFQRAGQGPGAEPWPRSLPSRRQWATADSQGLPGRGKGRKAKQSLSHASSVSHTPNNLMIPISGLHHRLSVCSIPLSEPRMPSFYCAL